MSAIGERYRIVRLLGKGAMGSVYEVERDDGARLALKVLTLGKNNADERRARFVRESDICARLQHPHLISVLDHGFDPDTGEPFLVMPLLEGSDLGECLDRESPLAPNVAAAIAYQAAQGLQSAHDAGVVHRDLKPSNLFLRRRDDRGVEVVVTDFGLAKDQASLDVLTRSGAFMGTAAYVAPEQASNAKHIDARADIWSLGMTLYHMLAGRPAFTQAGSFVALVLQITGSKVPSLQSVAPWIDPELARFVHAALLRDPGVRVPTATEFMIALDLATGGAASSTQLTEASLTTLPALERAVVAPIAALPASFADLLRN
jgi:serine/threonine-protein kinase